MEFPQSNIRLHDHKTQLPQNTRRNKYHQRHIAEAPLTSETDSRLTLLYTTDANPPTLQHKLLSLRIAGTFHVASP